MRGFVAIGLAVVVGAGALSACTSSSGGSGFCVPRLTVRPGTAHPGDTVTVSSSDVCDVPVPDRGWTVSVRQPLEDGREVTVRSADPFDGSWSTSVALPADFPVGETSVGIDNWDYSSCDDGASCAAASGDFRVRAPTPTPMPTPTP
ncbi:hypothetical protein [Curtobacterium sp. L1-20]|uniref:hypothetical protein n=1 Tax=Curtobacterium sp. L1-20 TaxID=3138181 RepID=UPI003B51B243